jgi:hypothetical protein
MPVVLDAATLRGAKQILDGPGARQDQGQFVSMDITALGSLLEAVCFTDDVMVPDLEHRSLSALTSEFGIAIKAVPLSASDRNAIADRARRWLLAWPDLENLIRVLGGSPVYRLAGSTYQYLLMQAIGVDGKYDSQVVRWVRHLRSADPTKFQSPRSWGTGPAQAPTGNDAASYEFVDPATDLHHASSFGHGNYLDSVLSKMLAELSLPPMGIGPHPELPINDRFVSHPSSEWGGGAEIMQFCSNLVWMTFRTLCYSLYARDNQVTYMPHPLRARVAGFATAGSAEREAVVFAAGRSGRVADLKRELEPDPDAQQSFAQQYTSRLDEVYEEAVDIALSVGATSLVRFPYPGVLPYIVRRAGSREYLLEAAYDVRRSRGARSLRSRIADFEQSVKSGDMRAAIALRDELDLVTRSLRQRLDLEQREPPQVSFAISAGVASATLRPRRRGSEPSKLAATMTKPWLVVLWNVFDALAAADALGDLYEMLWEHPAD